jgi:hypothetical protein
MRRLVGHVMASEGIYRPDRVKVTLTRSAVKLVLPPLLSLVIVNQRYSFRYLLYALQFLRVHVVVEPLSPVLHFP